MCCSALILSFIFLPVQKTSRHYLTICLVLGVGLMSARSIVSLAARPQLCHDAITPNDMHSNVPCAISGTLVCFGGFAAIMWGMYSWPQRDDLSR